MTPLALRLSDVETVLAASSAMTHIGLLYAGSAVPQVCGTPTQQM